MSNIENLKTLADVAHQSGNYDQSYSYYSRVLEEEIENSNAWLRKGLAAANLTTSDRDMIDETKVLIEKSLLMGLSDDDRRDAVNRLKVAYASISKRLDTELLGKVKDYQKVGMPSGGSALLHMAGQSVNKTLSAREQAAIRCKSLNLLETMCALANDAPSYEYAIRAIDALKTHAKAHGNYLSEGSTVVYGTSVNRLLDSMHTGLSNLRAQTTNRINTPSTDFNSFDGNAYASQKPTYKKSRYKANGTFATVRLFGSFFFRLILILGVIFALPGYLLWTVLSNLFKN